MKREAKERQSAGGGDKRSDKAKSVTSNLTEAVKKVPETAEIVAKKIGVSKNTYKGMKQIVSEGTPEQVAKKMGVSRKTYRRCKTIPTYR